MDSKTVREKHKEHLLRCTANYYEQPIVLAEGKGSYLTDLDGARYPLLRAGLDVEASK